MIVNKQNIIGVTVCFVLKTVIQRKLNFTLRKIFFPRYFSISICRGSLGFAFITLVSCICMFRGYTRQTTIIKRCFLLFVFDVMIARKRDLTIADTTQSVGGLVLSVCILSFFPSIHLILYVILSTISNQILFTFSFFLLDDPRRRQLLTKNIHITIAFHKNNSKKIHKFSSIIFSFFYFMLVHG